MPLLILVRAYLHKGKRASLALLLRIKKKFMNIDCRLLKSCADMTAQWGLTVPWVQGASFESHPPSLKKDWLELFFLRRLMRRRRQSSTTMPPSPPPSSAMISSSRSKAFSKATIFWMLALPLVSCINSNRPWERKYAEIHEQ